MAPVRIPPLAPGARIGVVLPSGPITPARAEAGLAALRARGFEPALFGDPFASSHGYFSAPDEIRLRHLNAALADESLAALWPLRGGYGLSRIIAGVECAPLKKRPKFLIGLSDLTLLAQKIRGETGLPFFYGPMVGALGNPDEFDPASLAHFLAAPSAPLSLRREGLVEIKSGRPVSGTLVGGCLSLLAAALGGPADLDEPGDLILFIEDLNEPIFRLDRMLASLRAAGRLACVKGALVGQMVNISTPEKSLTLEAMLREQFAALEGPVLAGIPCGHGPKTLTLPLYQRCEVGAEQIVFATNR